MKPCSECGETKPLAAFYKHSTNRDGRFGKCKSCVLAARRKRYEQDGETLRARVRDYAMRNPEKVVDLRHARRDTGKTRQAADYLLGTSAEQGAAS